MASQPKREITHGPDTTDYEDHPRYAAQYGYPPDEQVTRAVLRGLAYEMPDDAWEKALERFQTKREAVKTVGRIIHQALIAGTPYSERRRLYIRLMEEAGEELCVTCLGPRHDGACEDPDSGLWDVDEKHQSGGELPDSDNLEAA